MAAMRIENRPGWEGLPVASSWEPFVPELCYSVRLKERLGIPRDFATPHFDQALRRLLRERLFQVSYLVVPAQRVAELEQNVPPDLLWGPWQVAPAGHLFASELCWPLLRPGRNQPERIRKVKSSGLWFDSYCCHAFFALERDEYGRVIRLRVGGANSAECVATWLAVSDWIRARLRELQPGFRVPRRVSLPGTLPPRKRPKSPAFLRNERVRAALRAALEVEAKMAEFQLHGRGHEPRVSLDRRMARVARGLQLPVVTFVALRSDEYPRRVFERAGRALAAEHGREIISIQGSRVTLADHEGATR